MTESAVTQGGQAAYEVWRAAVPDVVCNVPGGAWEDLPATVQAGFSAVAAQQPQDARADEFARVKVRLSALVAELDENARLSGGGDCTFNAGARHVSVVTARQLRKILNDTALGTTPQPAPELAAAAPDTEATEMRAVIDMIWRMCQQPDGERLADRVSGLIKNSGMEPF